MNNKHGSVIAYIHEKRIKKFYYLDYKVCM